MEEKKSNGVGQDVLAVGMFVGGLVLVLGAIVGVHLVLNSWADLYYATSLWRGVQASAGFLLVLLPFVGLIIGLGVLTLAADFDGGTKTAVMFVGAVVVAASVGSLIPIVRLTNRAGYEGVKTYAAHTTRVDSAHDEYKNRLSLPQARLLIKRSLRGNSGSLGDVTYVPQGDRREWCGLLDVERPGISGHVWMNQVVCVDAFTGKTRSAKFKKDTVGTVDGGFRSNLADQVAEIRHGLTFTNEDVYGYIDPKGNANLVVPVTRWSGFDRIGRELPAGVVTFDHNGNRKLVEKVTPGQIPGPVMPMSMAAKVRESLNTFKGFVAYEHPKGKAGFVQTTSEGAEANVNSGNDSEFVLERADGRLVFVTPLTAYGSSRTVVGYLEVPADEVTARKVPTATFHRLAASKVEAPVEVVAQRISALYDADLDWATSNKGGANDNKARIFEITPAKAGEVVATIGVGDQALYRVVVESTLDETNTMGKVCIFGIRKGAEDQLIRCDAGDAAPLPIGSIRGLASATNTPVAPTTGDSPQTSGVDLSQVPTRALLDEIARRIPQG